MDRKLEMMKLADREDNRREQRELSTDVEYDYAPQKVYMFESGDRREVNPLDVREPRYNKRANNTRSYWPSRKVSGLGN